MKFRSSSIASYIAFCAFLLSGCSQIAEEPRFAVYYGNEAKPHQFTPFGLLVFDSEYHPELADLLPRHAILGYVSLAEAKPHQEVPENLVIGVNEAWQSKKIDLRESEWQKFLLHDQIPAILDQGFDGLMLDTADTAIHLEALEPEKYAGMKQAAISLIREIRSSFPHAKIMLNRGFEIHADVAPAIDMILAESILSRYDFEKKAASHFPDEVYQHYVTKIAKLRQEYPHLRVYSLDYWDMLDEKGVVEIYQTQRNNGFVPYVTTPDLRSIHTEPPASVLDSSATQTTQTEAI